MLTPQEHKRTFIAIIDDMAMMMLALVSAVLLCGELILKLSPELIEAIAHLDLLIAIIFCIEFFVRFHLSKDRVTFMKTYWWELLAAVPVTSELGQALRMLRLLRVMRLVAHIRTLWRDSTHIGEYRIT